MLYGYLALLVLELGNHLGHNLLVDALLDQTSIDLSSVPDLQVVHHVL
jgi:hypothetical protein